VSSILIAAPKSGSGKTLVTAGLLRHLRNRGLRVGGAKCGPDYIDPTFHARASGSACRNLDPWAMRPQTLASLVQELERETELAICEGVMGLFDGAGADGESGSTAELARLTGWPVVLLIDASGQGTSIAALVAGFARHDREVPLAGLILNRVASLRHRSLLVEALARHLPELPVLGALPHEIALTLPSRHLGLVTAEEVGDIEALIDRAAAQVAANCDIDRMVALARPTRCRAQIGTPGLPPFGQRIAVACDEAFCFIYESTLAAWRRQGAVISFFSPLADEPPDRGADAIFLPGGYPELHAGRLASADNFVARLRRAAGRGVAIYGECGGYMVLGETLTDADGVIHRMAGLLPLATSFAERRRHLGYRMARLLDTGLLGAAGRRFRGHEFHYATILHEDGADPLFALRDAVRNDLGHTGLRRGNVCGSFIHLIDRED
jgi:cobyrinic acid a,c-diamide synthase